ncbi:hypothetical protein [Leisingera daeponensis]|uniref:hypothetical protein n=1 Tax=Leisingera daeponensis TaxID=405746 RepID=UPI0021BD0730|nr:hypothetical protein [Leisingera daeponensis]
MVRVVAVTLWIEVVVSSEFQGQLEPMVDGSNLPDMSGLRKPVEIAQEIADDVMTDLDKLSRYLGRHPEGRGSLEAQALLPPELWELFPSDELEHLRSWAEPALASRNLHWSKGISCGVSLRVPELRGDEPMCLSLGRIELALAVGSENLKRDVCAFCPSKNQCQYKVQERYFLTKPPRVVFAPHDYAHIPVPGGWIPDAVILDENLRTGGIDMGTTTPANTILGYQIQPEKLLEAHRLTTPDTPMGPKEILAWRFRKEVLEAICEGQRFITHGGMVTVPKVRPFIWNEQALLVLDGTLSLL